MDRPFEYQPLPLTPCNASSPGSEALEEVLRSAAQQRRLCVSAAENCLKAVNDVMLTATATPYSRTSPGHFVLHTEPRLPAPNFEVPATLGASPCLSGNHNNLFAIDSPIHPTPRTGHLRQSANGASTGKQMDSLSRRLKDLERRHCQLLSDCELALKAAKEAREDRRRALQEVNDAERRLKELRETAQDLDHQVKLRQQRVHQELAEVTATLAARSQELDGATEKLDHVHKEILTSEEAYRQLTADIECARGRLEEVQSTTTLRHSTLEQQRTQQKQQHHEDEALQLAVKEKEDLLASLTIEMEAVSSQLALERGALEDARRSIEEIDQLLLKKESSAENAQQALLEAQEALSNLHAESVELSARMDARREVADEIEGRCEAAQQELLCKAAEMEQLQMAKEKLETEIIAVQDRLQELQRRAEDGAAWAAVADERAEAAAARAAAEELRAEKASRLADELKARCENAADAEFRLLELQARLGETEALAALREQIDWQKEEHHRLKKELSEAHRIAEESKKGCAVAEKRAEALDEKLSQALVELNDEREARATVERRCSMVQAALSRGEQALHQLSSQRASSERALEEAQHRTMLAENRLEAVEAQMIELIAQRDEALGRVETLEQERSDASSCVATLRKDIVRQEDALLASREEVTILSRALQETSKERKQLHALAESLELQVEALQERLLVEMARRHEANALQHSSMAKVSNKLVVTRQDERDDEHGTKLNRLVAQNAALKATAMRLSQALVDKLQNEGESSGAMMATCALVEDLEDLTF